MVRRPTDDAHESAMLKRRREAVEQLINLNTERPPDPGTLSRELEKAHEPGGIC